MNRKRLFGFALLLSILIMAGTTTGCRPEIAETSSQTSDKISGETADEAPSEPLQVTESTEDGLMDILPVFADPLNDIDFAALQAINPDIYGWIFIPGTNIDYPVLSNETDGYYLARRYDGIEDFAGSIFTDKYNSKAMTDPVTVLYGHYLANLGFYTMFTDLHQYTEEDFLKENPYIYLYLPGETLKYQIFAAVTHENAYLLSAYDLTTEADFTRYIDALYASPHGVTDEVLRPEYGQTVITLSTCIEEFPDMRWLVNGVLISRTQID